MALPQQLKTARMTNATLGSQIDDNVGALEQALADILGAPVNTDITNAIAEIVAAGLKSLYYQDAAADPTVNGQVRRNGTALKYHDGTRVRELTQVWVPAGVIVPYGGSVAPTGYLLCDGLPRIRANYPDLAVPFHARWRHFVVGVRWQVRSSTFRNPAGHDDIPVVRTTTAISGELHLVVLLFMQRTEYGHQGFPRLQPSPATAMP